MRIQAQGGQQIALAVDAAQSLAAGGQRQFAVLGAFHVAVALQKARNAVEDLRNRVGATRNLTAQTFRLRVELLPAFGPAHMVRAVGTAVARMVT